MPSSLAALVALPEEINSIACFLFMGHNVA
jgi:hypothetical protein